ncbi:MAG TPA: hypothetical protein VMK12_12800 [Anaeromyxobacteraceae bacterium]|nr:hypothetical protein [Anaeromyxobacteraceae bacterium]
MAAVGKTRPCGASIECRRGGGTKHAPPPASLVLALTFWQWQPIPSVARQVQSPASVALLWAVFGLG